MDRPAHLAALDRSLRTYPVVAVVGARQVGKTTLTRDLAARRSGAVTVFDLERPDDLARLSDPLLALEPLRGLVVIDEIQRRPDLFPVLRSLVDRRPLPARFLVLGSASPELLRQGSESLAGRIHTHALGGFSLDEVGAARLERLWLRGGFPRSYLARSADASFLWREDFVTTLLERDLPQMGPIVPAVTMRRFWIMLAHYHAQLWNGAELARAFAMGETTVRRYLDALAGAFMVRALLPWHENSAKRLVKAPKVYVTDAGILHALLRVRDLRDLESHPKVGASWEGFALGVVESRLGTAAHDAWFWATHGGAELDLLIVHGKTRLGFEFKRTTVPQITKSMRIALEDLKLDALYLVHAGPRTFDLAPRVRALALGRVLEDLEGVRP
jgi:predicted AAA+ superfamily ATPase